MKIHDGGQPIRPHIQTKDLPASIDKKAGQGASKPSSNLTSVETGSIENLKALLAGSSDVREALVQEIKLKLQTGEYLTQKAAVETADAILNL